MACKAGSGHEQPGDQRLFDAVTTGDDGSGAHHVAGAVGTQSVGEATAAAAAVRAVRRPPPRQAVWR